MIKQYFPSTKVKPWYNITPPRVLTPQTPLLPSGITVTAREKAQALRMGISVEVYQQRCLDVAKASNECKFSHGDVVYPVKPSDLKKYGACIVVGVIRHYDQYGAVEWRDGNPFILTLARCANRTETINCTANWATSKKPEVHSEC